MRSQAETPKRYRYTGKERDEESGLEYHTARYCAVWLGRWVSTDPAGLNGGINLYGYAHGNPIRYSDQSGAAPDEVLPGLLTDYPHLGQAWDDAAENILENKYGKGTYEKNLEAFHNALDRLPEGPKRTALAREVFGSVRRSFYRSVGKLYAQGKKVLGNIDLPKEVITAMKADGTAPVKLSQIDHAIDELAENPYKALDAMNLGLRYGHARVPGGSHYKATEGRKGLKKVLGGIATVLIVADAGVAAAHVGNRLWHGDPVGAAREVGSFAYDQTIGVVADTISLAKGIATAPAKFVSDPFGVKESVEVLKTQEEEAYAELDDIFGQHEQKAPPVPPVAVAQPAPRKPSRGDAVEGMMLFEGAVALVIAGSANSPAPAISSSTGSQSSWANEGGLPFPPMNNPFCPLWPIQPCFYPPY